MFDKVVLLKKRPYAQPQDDFLITAVIFHQHISSVSLFDENSPGGGVFIQTSGDKFRLYANFYIQFWNGPELLKMFLNDGSPASVASILEAFATL